MIGPGLGHVSHNGHGVLLRVKLQYVVKIMTIVLITRIITIATWNYGVLVYIMN